MLVQPALEETKTLTRVLEDFGFALAIGHQQRTVELGLGDIDTEIKYSHD